MRLSVSSAAAGLLLSFAVVAHANPIQWDWDFPEKGNVTVGLAKYPARKPESRIGSVFWQPGGPGEPATQHIALIEPGLFYVAPNILDQFDIIGVDIRGTGTSSPINCDADIFNTRMPWPIDTQEKWDFVVQTNLAFRESCLNKSGNNLIDYMDSISIARDYEAIRIALGGEPMNWLGMSYGPTLGSLYAERFPYNIRSMVLDGAIASPTDKVTYFAESAAGSETAFKAALRWCDGGNPSDPNCPPVPKILKNRPLEQLWNRIIAQAEVQPMNFHWVVGRVEQLGPATAIYNATLYNDTAAFVRESPIARNAADPRSVQGYTNSYKFSNRAVICQDEPHGYTGWADMKRLDIMGQNLSPLVRGVSPAFTFQLYCLGWPGNVRNPPHAVNIPRTEKLPKILMSQVIYDPATPLSVGMKLREDIGDDRVVTILKDGGGHGAYQATNASTSEAVAAISAYVFNLTLPADATVFSN